MSLSLLYLGLSPRSSTNPELNTSMTERASCSCNGPSRRGQEDRCNRSIRVPVDEVVDKSGGGEGVLMSALSGCSQDGTGAIRGPSIIQSTCGDGINVPRARTKCTHVESGAASQPQLRNKQQHTPRSTGPQMRSNISSGSLPCYISSESRRKCDFRSAIIRSKSSCDVDFRGGGDIAVRDDGTPRPSIVDSNSRNHYISQTSVGWMHNERSVALNQTNADEAVVPDAARSFNLFEVDSSRDHCGDAENSPSRGPLRHPRWKAIEAGAPLATATPNVFDEMDYIRNKLENKAICIFLDYDGTMTPIVSNPMEARLSAEFRETLRVLSETHPVAIVTGRKMSTIRSFIAIDDDPEKRCLMYAASHGFDIDTGRRQKHAQHRVGQEHLPLLHQATKCILSEVGHITGLVLEDNTFTISIHYRHCIESYDAIEHAVDRVLRLFPMLRKTKGIMVLELRLNLNWNKGNAVLWILENMGFSTDDENAAVIYVGDDLTDEDAFAAVRRCANGVAVVVNPRKRRTEATFHVDGPLQVKKLLEQLITLPRSRIPM